MKTSMKRRCPCTICGKAAELTESPCVTVGYFEDLHQGLRFETTCAECGAEVLRHIRVMRLHHPECLKRLQLAG